MSDDSNYSNRESVGTIAGTEIIPVWKDTMTSNRNLRTTTADLKAYVLGDISVPEITVLDGVTAGTVVASKAVVVDANKDISSFRNVTATGTLSGGTVSGTSGNFTTNTTTDRLDTASTITLTADAWPAATLVKLNNASVAIVKSVTVAQGGMRVITQADAGTIGHVLTMTGGTFDGTNNTATFASQYASIAIYGVAAGHGLLLANQDVVLSSVA